MRIDAHQHFWDYGANAADYRWMGPDDAPLRRDFLPADLAPLLRAARYDACVAVQARELGAETDWLLALAAGNPFVCGVVGWLDLTEPTIADVLDCYASAPVLKGLRMLIHDHPDPEFAASPAHVRGVALLEARGLAYDLLVRPEHLGPALRLVDRLPHQRFVVDHIAKPALDGSDRDLWVAGLAALAKRPNLFCKLSGLVTLRGWPRHSAVPFLDEVLAMFGPERLMIGSDWPVATLGASYGATMGIVESWAARLSAAERDAILAGTCSRFYGLG